MFKTQPHVLGYETIDAIHETHHIVVDCRILHDGLREVEVIHRNVYIVLIDTDLLETESKHNTTYYRATPQGEETIRFFSGDISPEIRTEITAYLKQHAKELRGDSQITAEYTKTADQGFLVHCRVQEGVSALIDLKLTVPTETAAQTLSENWKARSQEAYESLMKLLLS